MNIPAEVMEVWIILLVALSEKITKTSPICWNCGFLSSNINLTTWWESAILASTRYSFKWFYHCPLSMRHTNTGLVSSSISLHARYPLSNKGDLEYCQNIAKGGTQNIWSNKEGAEGFFHVNLGSREVLGPFLVGAVSLLPATVLPHGENMLL